MCLIEKGISIEETTRAGRKMVLVQHFQRDDWYWKAEASFREQWANHQHTQRGSGNCSLSHQYSVLGLDRYLWKYCVLCYSVPCISSRYIRM